MVKLRYKRNEFREEVGSKSGVPATLGKVYKVGLFLDFYEIITNIH
jgi:hypothetical protein